MKKIRYLKCESFEKSFKKLSKRFKTLSEDLEVAKRNAIELLHINSMDNLSIAEIPGFSDDSIRIFKLRKFACKALKGRGVKSGIRIIYAFNFSEMEVTFIEIYFKQDQECEDIAKIKTFLLENFEDVF